MRKGLGNFENKKIECVLKIFQYMYDNLSFQNACVKLPFSVKDKKRVDNYGR